MPGFTNSAALRVLKAISLDESHGHTLSWRELTADLGFPPEDSTVRNISKRNGYWPDGIAGELYDWREHYEICFRRYVGRAGTAKTITTISQGLRNEGLADARTPRFIELVEQAESTLGGNSETCQTALDKILRYILEMSSGGAGALRQARANAGNLHLAVETSAGRIGFTDAYWNPTEAQFWKKISEAKKRIDIIHFHGLSWTNTNREFLVARLSDPKMTMRVALLDPDSPFYDPYAEFIGLDPSVLRSKFEEAVNIWRLMYNEVRSAGKHGKLELYKYLGFPAKSIYRFDNQLVITPTTNARPKSQFVALRAEKKRDGLCAYSAYMKEVAWIMKNGTAIPL